MKKFKFIAFLAALIAGVFLVNALSFGSLSYSPFSFSFFSCANGSGVSKSETRDISGFSNIDVSGALKVEITAQQDFGVEVTADDNLLEHIVTEVKGDTLKIYSKGKLRTKSPMIVKITIPEINELEVSGASNANLSGVKNESLTVNASGASKIILSGEAENLNLDASGACRIDAENLKAENANADASGASTLILSVANELRADASGASSVRYTGEPKNIIKDISGASSVKKN